MMRPAPLLQHLSGREADGIEGSLQVCLDDFIKILLRHLHQKSVPCNARIVDKDIQSSVGLDDVLDELLALLKIRHIALVHLSLSAGRLDLLLYFLRSVL